MSTTTTRRRRLVAVGLLSSSVVATFVAATGTSSAAPKGDAGGKDTRPATTLVADDGSSRAVKASKVSAPEAAPAEGTGNLADSEGVSFSESSSSSAQPVGAESILGADNRYRITDTRAYPARATVRITSSIGQCTGWMIDDDTVATAGHCLHNGSSWATGVSVAPGQNGSVKPYGSCGSRGLHSVLGWTRDRNWEYDYGVIKLNCTVGNTVGWYGLRWTTASLNGVASITRGYPGDKPAEQWASNGTVRRSDVRKLFYTNDTVGGQSGSPVYDYVNGNGPYGIAVHAYGTNDGGATNSGTRITQAVFNNFQNWKSL